MRRLRLDLLLLVVAVVWGGSYLAAKQLVAAVGVEPALALRYGIAALGLLLVVLVRRPARPDRRLLVVGLALGVSQAAVLWLETAGVGRTSATNAGLLISLSLVLTPLLEALLLRRRLPVAFHVLVVVAIVGVGLLASPEGIRAPGPGDLLVLAAALLRAGHVAATSRLLRPGDDVRTLVLVQLLVGAVVFAAIAAPRLGPALAALPLGGWAGAVYLGLGCSVFAFLVQAWAVRRSSAARAALLMGTEPLWAALIGVLLGGDGLAPAQLVGAALIVLGALGGAEVERRSRERRAVAPAAELWQNG